MRCQILVNKKWCDINPSLLKFNIVGIIAILLLNSISFSQNKEWRIFNTENSKLPDNNVLSLAIDKHGKKWIGTKYGGLVMFDGENWEIFKPDTLNCILNANRPNVRFDVFNEEKKKSIKSVYKRHYPTNEVNENLGLSKILSSGPQHNAFYDLAIDSQGFKWIGTKINGIIKTDGEEWIIYNKSNSDLLDNYAWSIAIDNDDKIWVGTQFGGLANFDGIDWKIYHTGNSLIPGNRVWSIKNDKDNIKWIGTGSGLAKFDGLKWEIFDSDNSGLPENFVRTVVIDKENTKWIGTFGGGLAKYDDVNWTNYNDTNSGLPENYIWSLAIDDECHAWVGTKNGYLVKFDGVSWSVQNDDYSEVQFNCPIWDIVIDDQGNKWIGTGLGLAVFREGGLDITNIEANFNHSYDEFYIYQNYPNPFNVFTEITFSLSKFSPVKIIIYNIRGQLVLVLADAEYAPGVYRLKWGGKSYDNRPVDSGLYFYRMITNTGAITKKMMLLQ